MSDNPKKTHTLLAGLENEDLETILASIQGGAKNRGEALGFAREEQNRIESLALGYYRTGHYESAQKLYALLLEMNREHASAWRGMGACYQAQHKYTQAMTCYEFALKWTPEDIVSGVFYAECLCLVDDKGRGIQLLKQIIQHGTKDEHYMPYITRARAIVSANGDAPPLIRISVDGHETLAQQDRKDLKPVEFAENRTMTVDDIRNNPELYASFKEVVTAIKNGTLTYADVGGFTPEEMQGAYFTACNVLESGQILKAMQIAAQLLFMDPYQSSYYHLVGICFQRIKDYYSAELFYDLALAMEPNDVYSMIYLGECKVMTKEIDEATTLFEQALKLTINNPEYAELEKRVHVLMRQFQLN